MKTRVDFLRHGEPQGGSRYRGHGIDDPLSEKGWLQMEQGVGDFRQWDSVVTSPLRRCAEFAETIARGQDLTLQLEPGFREIGFGCWEGKTKSDLRRERLDEFQAFYENPVANTPEGAEPVVNFYQRIEQNLEALIQQNPERHVLVVAHAGVIRAAIAYALDLDCASMYRIRIDNGRVSRIYFGENEHQLEGVNICL